MSLWREAVSNRPPHCPPAASYCRLTTSFSLTAPEKVRAVSSFSFFFFFLFLFLFFFFFSLPLRRASSSPSSSRSRFISICRSLFRAVFSPSSHYPLFPSAVFNLCFSLSPILPLPPPVSPNPAISFVLLRFAAHCAPYAPWCMPEKTERRRKGPPSFHPSPAVFSRGLSFGNSRLAGEGS